MARVKKTKLVARPAVDLEEEKRLWALAVDDIRQSPELHESILRSVMSSMAFEGFPVDRAESELLFELALNGPPLVYEPER